MSKLRQSLCVAALAALLGAPAAQAEETGGWAAIFDALFGQVEWILSADSVPPTDLPAAPPGDQSNLGPVIIVNG